MGQVTHPPLDAPTVTPLDRIRTRSSILSCTSCDLSTKCRRPVPWDGPAPNDFLVIGEAPGASEDREGRPFVGPSGTLLRNTLRYAGVEPDLLTFANTVSCYPPYKPATPRLEHVDACAPVLARTLKVVAPRFILLVGAVALSRFRADLRISTSHGRPFTVPAPWSPASRGGTMWCFPVIHPASILRDTSQRESWTTDLRAWVALISTPLDQLATHLPITCTGCHREVERYDPDGLAWCEGHVGKGTGGWQSAVRKRSWMLRTEMRQQPSMMKVAEAVKKVEDPT